MSIRRPAVDMRVNGNRGVDIFCTAKNPVTPIEEEI
jgi:hypothetical protein